MDYPNGTPKKVTNNNFTEAQPCWSPDGKLIYFATWNVDGGSIRFIDVATNKETTLTKENALYQGLAMEPSGKRLVFNRTTTQKFKDSKEPRYQED